MAAVEGRAGYTRTREQTAWRVPAGRAWVGRDGTFRKAGSGSHQTGNGRVVEKQQVNGKLISKMSRKAAIL